MQKEKIIENILKECFWDMFFTVKEIDAILNGDDFRKKAFLFDKILLNSTNLFSSLNLFQKKDLEKLITKYKIPSFNRDTAERRLNLTQVYFLNLPLTIKELRWNI